MSGLLPMTRGRWQGVATIAAVVTLAVSVLGGWIASNVSTATGSQRMNDTLDGHERRLSVLEREQRETAAQIGSIKEDTSATREDVSWIRKSLGR